MTIDHQQERIKRLIESANGKGYLEYKTIIQEIVEMGDSVRNCLKVIINGQEGDDGA